MNPLPEGALRFYLSKFAEKAHMDKFSNLKPEYKIWFSTLKGEGLLGDGKWKILKAIEQSGSLVGACEQLGITYRRTWNDLRKIEKMLGFPLLETVRGGQEGGSSCLSAEGRKLVKAFDLFHGRVDKLMQKEFQKLIADLNE
jgi:molybdate transport system regulatory protein